MYHQKLNEHLVAWKNRPGRKPLVIRGARQVGKTYAVKCFAKEHFEDLIYINLERSEDWEAFHDVHSMRDFERTAHVLLGRRPIPGKTLVFFDEIQHAPKLIELLRFFHEDRSDLHVIAAGSLLEAMFAREGLEMPVGRVEYAWVYPLTFFEFLHAMQEYDLLAHLKTVTLDEGVPTGVHRKALDLFHSYALVGGMPEVVERYAEKRPYDEIRSLYASLLTGYAEDIYKYARTAEVKYVRHILEHAPYAAGERVTYEKFGNSSYRSREMGEAFDLLGRTMLVHQIPATKSRELPLIGRKKAAKKLLFLDVGLVNHKNDLEEAFVRFDDVSDIIRGRIAKQVVGQNLLAADMQADKPLFYWAKDTSEGSAEVDFCLTHNGRIVGIEVKSGHAGHLKSLASLKDAAPDTALVRISTRPLARESVASLSGEGSYQVCSVPFYLMNRWHEFV